MNKGAGEQGHPARTVPNASIHGSTVSVATSQRGGAEWALFRGGMSCGDGIGQEVGACAAQVFQGALLVGTEGAKPLRVGVHPDGEALPGAGVELDLVMAFGLRQEGQQGAGRSRAFARSGKALAVAVRDLVSEARFSVAHQGVI